MINLLSSSNIMNNVCFDRTYFTVIIIAITCLAFYNLYAQNVKLQEVLNQCGRSAGPESESNVFVKPVEHMQTETTIIPTVDAITEYDYRNLSDPLQQPGRRGSRYEIGPLAFNPHLNIPTRGYPDTFSLQGYLVDEHATTSDPNRIIKLFGRQTYPTGSEWEYYVEVNVAYDKLKTDLHKQKREIFDGDNVYVSLLKKNYQVKLLRNNTLEYNPFVL